VTRRPSIRRVPAQGHPRKEGKGSAHPEARRCRDGNKAIAPSGWRNAPWRNRPRVRSPLPWLMPLVLLAGPVAASPLREAETLALVPGDRVLLIYDSREEAREDRNPLVGPVAETLAAMGLGVRWWDWAEGAPGDLSGIRGVVTGFRDGRMPDARAHVAFAADLIQHGIRYVVLGSFGAFQEDRDGSFLPAEEVNRVFRPLGVRYDAWWTDDPTRFTTRVQDPRLGAPDAVRAQDVRHFFQITPIRPDVHLWVSGQRTDPAEPRSAPVFTSAMGGLALTRYLFVEDDPPRLRSGLDLRPFLEEALALGPRAPGTPLVIHDPSSSDSRRVLKSLSQAASYLGISLATVQVDQGAWLRPCDLRGFRSVVLALPEVPSPLDGYLKGLLTQYLSEGGRVVAPLPLRNPQLAPVIGGTPGAPAVPARIRQLQFEASAFPGLDGFQVTVDDEDAWNALAPAIRKSCTAWIRGRAAPGAGPEVPLAWRCREDAGEVSALGVWEFADRAYLGILAQALLDGQGMFAMPVLAARLEFVDDCPLPMTGRELPAMGKSDIRFYLDDFLGTLLDLSRRHDLRPTVLAVFTYDDRTEGPYGEPWPGPTRESSLEMARRLIDQGLPIGIHGITHVSPALSGGVNRPFPGEGALRESFRAARQAYLDLFGPENRPAVYVPPNDYIDRAGKRALVQAVPEVQVLASVLSGSDVETSQDLGIDTEEPSLVALPRTWAGMRLEGEAAMGLVNGLLLQVVSSHFLHPDDALDPERSGGLPWGSLKAAWEQACRELVTRFGYLRPMTALEAAGMVRLEAATGLRIDRPGPGILEVRRASGHPGSLPLLVRLPPGCRPRWTGGRPRTSHPASGRHLVDMEASTLTATCEPSGLAGSPRTQSEK